jgi:TRAP-type mannitol/chloroaromatic compound transport system permease small subunit
MVARMRAIAAMIGRLSDAAGALASWMVLVMVLLAAGNALLRYGARLVGVAMGSNAFVELQWYLFSWVFLLGGVAALRADAHVRVDVWYARLGRRAQAGLNLVGTLVFLLPFCAFGLYFCWPAMVNSVSVWEGSPDPSGLPRWPLKVSLWASFGLLALQGFAQVLTHAADLVDREAT